MSNAQIGDTLAELQRQVGRAIVTELIRTFSVHSSELLVELRRNGGADSARIREIAHSLKSSSAAMGADLLSDACRDLEKSFLDKTSAPLKIDKLAELHRETLEALALWSRENRV